MSFENIPMATQEDLAAIGRLIKPQEPPERIYGWLDSQLSIARFYGGCTYQGHSYVIDPIRPNPPLVRVDVLQRETREKVARKVASSVASSVATKSQGVLL